MRALTTTTASLKTEIDVTEHGNDMSLYCLHDEVGKP